MITIELSRSTPGLNVWQRMNHFKRSKLKKSIAAEIYYLAHNAKAPKATTRRHVKVTRFSPGTLDPDNLPTACKTILDGLVKAGLLIDDSPAWLELECKQVKQAKKGTRIEITDILYPEDEGQ